LRRWETEESLRRGMAALEQQDYPSACEHFERMRQLAPELPHGHAYHGLALAYQGELVRAIADYSQAVSVNPDLGVNYRLRGIAQANRGRLQDALEDLGRAIQLDPNDMASHRVRALVYLKLGHLRAALQDRTAMQDGQCDTVVLPVRIAVPSQMTESGTESPVPVWERCGQLLQTSDDERRVLIQVQRDGQSLVGWLARDQIEPMVPF
jgi:hypothetical protein